MMKAVRTFCGLAVLVAVCSDVVVAQDPVGRQATPPGGPASAPGSPVQAPPASLGAATPPAAYTTPPGDYVIGVDDVLVIMFWRDKDMSSEVVVRPDGRITLPLINDIVAVGLTPDQLREGVIKEASRFVEEPSPNIVVKTINSRKVFITGEVARPGPYGLSGPTTVLQLIAMAGGLREYARKGDIVIMRSEAGKVSTFLFDYGAVIKLKKLQQNILLKPGDTIVVP